MIVDFIRRKLKSRGVLYISYNTLPGWAAFVPMRHLSTNTSITWPPMVQGSWPKIDSALRFFETMLAVNPAYGRANPLVKERFASLKEGNRHYLAHEYFNRDWHPMHFRTSSTGLSRPSWTLPVPPISLISFLQPICRKNKELLKRISDPYFRESVRDFIVNQQFRRDYWIKGARQLLAATT